jgi:hypothetical protein
MPVLDLKTFWLIPERDGAYGIGLGEGKIKQLKKSECRFYDYFIPGRIGFIRQSLCRLVSPLIYIKARTGHTD